jgi:hypothetical protein
VTAQRQITWSFMISLTTPQEKYQGTTIITVCLDVFVRALTFKTNWPIDKRYHLFRTIIGENCYWIWQSSFRYKTNFFLNHHGTGFNLVHSVRTAFMICSARDYTTLIYDRTITIYQVDCVVCGTRIRRKKKKVIMVGHAVVQFHDGSKTGGR